MRNVPSCPEWRSSRPRSRQLAPDQDHAAGVDTGDLVAVIPSRLPAIPGGRLPLVVLAGDSNGGETACSLVRSGIARYRAFREVGWQEQDGVVATVEFDPGKKRVTVDEWSYRVGTMHRAPMETHVERERWEALLRIRRRVSLLVIAEQHGRSVWVEAWAGDPDKSAGLAVPIADDHLVGVGRIPLCGCGERGCGNTGIQLAAEYAADDFPVLVAVLRELRDVADVPQRGHTWDGRIRDGVPVI